MKADCQSAEDTIEKNEKEAKLHEEKFAKDFNEAVLSEKARTLYPERGGERHKTSWWDVLWKGEGRDAVDKIKCERNVYKVLQSSPLVKILMGALKSSGCEVDIRRHISCEVCTGNVTGGYDPYLNQVVVCQNKARSKGLVQGVLTHEMIHMFDYCRKDIDMKNIKHLACTEIRAANLAHCSFLSAVSQGSASFINIKQKHADCVKNRAVASVLAVRDVTEEEAWKVVESVFPKCYSDLEPIGRRIRRNSDHMEKAYLDRINVGYD